MRLSRIAAIAAAAVVTVTPAVLAQTSTPPQTQTPTVQTPPQSRDTAATQTFTGCLMTERDYRRAHNLGDGALGGVGLGDEFVLVDVKVSAAPASPAAAPPSDRPAVAASASTSPTTCADKGVAYRVMGSDEEKLKDFVGRQVAIVGRFKEAADATGAAQTAEKLPAEIEIVSFSEAPATAPVTAPASDPVTATPPPPPPPPAASSTVQATRPTTTPATPPVTEPAPAAAAERRELPRTASSSALLALIGVVALSSGVVLTVLRRRAL